MPDGETDGGASSADPRADLAAQLRQLESFVQSSAAAGEEAPPEAAEMLARLKEIITALDGLSVSLAQDESGRSVTPDAS